MTREEMREKTCCFTGHRDITKKKAMELYFEIQKTAEYLINEKGVVYFGAGGALGFDMTAEKAILKLKKKYPFIKLILVLPCKNFTSRWTMMDKLTMNSIIRQADKVVYASEKFTPYCLNLRNRRLVNHSKYCISHLTKGTGGTAYTVSYAEENELEIINLA